MKNDVKLSDDTKHEIARICKEMDVLVTSAVQRGPRARQHYKAQRLLAEMFGVGVYEGIAQMSGLDPETAEETPG